MVEPGICKGGNSVLMALVSEMLAMLGAKEGDMLHIATPSLPVASSRVQ